MGASSISAHHWYSMMVPTLAPVKRRSCCQERSIDGSRSATPLVHGEGPRCSLWEVHFLVLIIPLEEEMDRLFFTFRYRGRYWRSSFLLHKNSCATCLCTLRQHQHRPCLSSSDGCFYTDFETSDRLKPADFTVYAVSLHPVGSCRRHKPCNRFFRDKGSRKG